MISAAALRKLAALSLSPEQMAGVLDILADGAEAEEARKAAQRDRTRRHRSRDGNVTDTLQARDPSLEKERSPKPPKENSTLPRSPEANASSDRPAAGRKGTRLDPNWSPSKAVLDWVKDERLPDDFARRELAKFRDFWVGKAGKDAVKADWDATYRNWLRRAADDRGIAPTSTASTPGMASVEQWEARLGYARKTAAWDRPKWGPPPSEPGCVVPPELLKPGDGNGWKPPNEASAA